MSPEANTEFLDEVARALRKGRSSSLVAPSERDEIVRRLEAVSTDAGVDEALRLEARARAAQLLLLSGRKHDACRVLGPLVQDEESRERLRAESRGDPDRSFAAGLLLAQTVNALYRLFEHRQGTELARVAEELLERGRARGLELDRVLAVYENRTWWARSLWRREDYLESESLLLAVLEGMETALGSIGGEDRGGMELSWAHALDFSAYCDWTRGRFDAARRKIYQSLFLHMGGHADSPIRKGHALYIAGRIEGTAGRFGTAQRLLELAEELLRENDHPLFARVAVQRVHTSCKELDMESARARLESLRPEVERTIVDADERNYILSDMLLAEIWIEESKARGAGTSTMGVESWRRCAELANELYQGQGPTRLRIEGLLHRGLALALLPEEDETRRRKNHERARKDLHEALKLARERELIKVQIAAHFALSEASLQTGDSGSSFEHWSDGSLLLMTAESSFLSRWKDELGRRITSAPIVVRIDPDKKFTEARTIFEKEYMKYHRARTRTQEEMAAKIGMPRPTLNQRLGKLGLGGRKR